MQSYRKRSRNVLFLGEMVLALTIFALCAVVCASLLWQSHRISEESSELNQAVFLAQNALEAGRVVESPAELARILEGQELDSGCQIYYDAAWRRQEEAAGASYCLEVQLIPGSPYREVVAMVLGVVSIHYPDIGVTETAWDASRPIYHLTSMVYTGGLE